MKQMIKYFILLFTVGILFNACDIVDEPYLEDNAFVWNGQKILILDFTGQRCGYCPNGHRVIEQLQMTYPEAIVPIAVHCSFLGMAITTDTTQAFHYPFINDLSASLGGDMTSNGYFNITEQPVGVINHFSPEAVIPPGAWATESANYISNYPEFSIQISTELTNNTISADINLKTEIKTNRNLRLAAYITESHIIQWQEDYSAETSPIEHYEHNHVLRASMNGTFGEIINENTSLSVGNEIEKSYEINLSENWKPENCHLVVFVYDADDKTVLQVETKTLTH
jgi:hypothetical protein